MFTIYRHFSLVSCELVAVVRSAEDAFVCVAALHRDSMNKCEEDELPFEFTINRPDGSLMKTISLRD